MHTDDTIAAIATPPGRGSIGVVRISGPDAYKLGAAITKKSLTPRVAHYGSLYDTDDSPIDESITIYFKAPHSFTGEDIVEFQCHGGPVVLDLLLKACTTLGARLANPGEFSERAFLNDKLDLAQAEAISDLINASSEQAARSAVNTLKGAFSEKIVDIVDNLTALRIYTEAAIDFPEEEIDFLNDGVVLNQLSEIKQQVDELLANAHQGSLLSEGFNLVIAGRPNAGKSSLLNRLAGHDRAIVTDIAGTTRDLIQEKILIDGLPINLVDTAGIRDSEDIVEQEGIRRSWDEIHRADTVLLIIDANDSTDVQALYNEFSQDNYDPARTIVAINKVDKHPPKLDHQGALLISAKTGEGIDELKQAIKAHAGYTPGNEQGFIARRRHIDAIERAKLLIDSGYDQLTLAGAGELLAEDLRLAQDALGEITGKLSSDDLLGKIFSSFCIGK